MKIHFHCPLPLYKSVLCSAFILPLHKSVSLWLSAFVLLSSCTRDFVELDLSTRNVVLLSPPDNYITASNTINFWWEETDGAFEYHLQIVDSSFSYITQLMLDTTIESEQFSFSLPPGDYQWRVKALNGSSSTSYTVPRSLTVDTTSNISTQTILLLSPTNNLSTNTTALNFRWSPLGSADDYRFQVLNSRSQIITDQVITDDSISYTLSSGTYPWKVRGQNSVSNTPYSTRTITIDLVGPVAPALLLPTHGDTLPNPVALSWSRDASATGDSLFIYTDSLVSAPVYMAYLTPTTYSFTGTSTQIYFWRLKSRDAAGNWSAYSTVRKFKVQ